MAESAARMKEQQAQEEADRKALAAKVRAQLRLKCVEQRFCCFLLVLTRIHPNRAERCTAPNRDTWKTR